MVTTLVRFDGKSVRSSPSKNSSVPLGGWATKDSNDGQSAKEKTCDSEWVSDVEMQLWILLCGYFYFLSFLYIYIYLCVGVVSL